MTLKKLFETMNQLNNETIITVKSEGGFLLRKCEYKHLSKEIKEMTVQSAEFDTDCNGEIWDKYFIVVVKDPDSEPETLVNVLKNQAVKDLIFTLEDSGKHLSPLTSDTPLPEAILYGQISGLCRTLSALTGQNFRFENGKIHW